MSSSELLLRKIVHRCWAMAAVFLAAPVAAQEPSVEEVFSAPVRWEWGAFLLAGEPVGEFSRHSDGGGGFGLVGIRYLGADRSLGIRVDLALMSYGRTSASYALTLVGTPIDVEVTTDNSVAHLAVGPHLELGSGPVRPYLDAAIGAAQFVTTTAAWSGGLLLPIATAEVLERYTLQLAAGGGLRMSVRERRRHPLSFELGGRYQHHGTVEYLGEGGLRERPDGTIELDPIVSDADFWTVQVGATIGVR